MALHIKIQQNYSNNDALILVWCRFSVELTDLRPTFGIVSSSFDSNAVRILDIREDLVLKSRSI